LFTVVIRAVLGLCPRLLYLKGGDKAIAGVGELQAAIPDGLEVELE
jgi:hypothetical protein